MIVFGVFVLKMSMLDKKSNSHPYFPNSKALTTVYHASLQKFDFISLNTILNEIDCSIFANKEH